jgi:hypothetical protein
VELMEQVVHQVRMVLAEQMEHRVLAVVLGQVALQE